LGHAGADCDVGPRQCTSLACGAAHLAESRSALRSGLVSAFLGQEDATVSDDLSGLVCGAGLEAGRIGQLGRNRAVKSSS
jgi:hypothetical protein